MLPWKLWKGSTDAARKCERNKVDGSLNPFCNSCTPSRGLLVLVKLLLEKLLQATTQGSSEIYMHSPKGSMYLIIEYLGLKVVPI